MEVFRWCRKWGNGDNAADDDDDQWSRWRLGHKWWWIWSEGWNDQKSEPPGAKEARIAFSEAFPGICTQSSYWHWTVVINITFTINKIIIIMIIIVMRTFDDQGRHRCEGWPSQEETQSLVQESARQGWSWSLWSHYDDYDDFYFFYNFDNFDEFDDFGYLGDFDDFDNFADFVDETSRQAGSFAWRHCHQYTESQMSRKTRNRFRWWNIWKSRWWWIFWCFVDIAIFADDKNDDNIQCVHDDGDNNDDVNSMIMTSCNLLDNDDGCCDEDVQTI